MHLVKEGIPASVISVLVRYIHSSSSIARVSDIDNTIRLILA
ncbi:MAG TPA: M42 family peptidase, partial [Thermofilum sp.]|nr:M42 family peptidase [Thermofilum sp.]